MSTAAYDAKNEESFEAVTLALEAALKKMDKDFRKKFPAASKVAIRNIDALITKLRKHKWKAS